MKILFVEDDPKLLELLSGQLAKTGMVIDRATDGEDGLFLANEGEYDCIILDINLPKIDGLEVCRRLRANKKATPIIMLTARGEIDERITGLTVGADDYVAKPVDSRELIARIYALVRRSNKDPLPIITVGDLEIKPQAQTVKLSGKLMTLNAKEYAVLEYLARHSDEIVTRTMIMEQVWGSDFETLSNVVDVYIRYLRKKIDSGRKNPLIHTIRGSGYMLSDKK